MVVWWWWIGSWGEGEGEGSRASVPVLVGDSGKWVRGDIKGRHCGKAPKKLQRCRTTEYAERRSCRSAESKCVCYCCYCFSLIHEKKNITALVQLVLQELVPGPFCLVVARLAPSSDSSSDSSSSAGGGG